MLRLCDELWLCGGFWISPGMAGEKEMAERLGIPKGSVSTEEIQSMELSPAEEDGDVHGMNLTMGSLFDGIGGFRVVAGSGMDQNSGPARSSRSP